jgi:hypothetical protein
VGSRPGPWQAEHALFHWAALPTPIFGFNFFIVWVGIECGIYKSSYNILNTTYLNSPPPSFSFTTPIPGTAPFFVESWKETDPEDTGVGPAEQKWQPKLN